MNTDKPTARGIINPPDVPKRLRDAVQRTIETIAGSRLCSMGSLNNTHAVQFAVDDLTELVSAFKAAAESAGVPVEPKGAGDEEK